jgi:uncharacterized membrane-anchored protein YhcB (DUF1043 family)
MDRTGFGLVAVGMVLGFIIGLLVCDLGKADPYTDMQDWQLRNEMMLKKKEQQIEQYNRDREYQYKNPC